MPIIHHENITNILNIQLSHSITKKTFDLRCLPKYTRRNLFKTHVQGKCSEKESSRKSVINQLEPHVQVSLHVAHPW